MNATFLPYARLLTALLSNRRVAIIASYIPTFAYTTKRVLLGLCVLALAACSKPVELQRNLAEADANEVIAELAEKQVQADKIQGKDGVTVLVEQQDMARSVRILNAAGLPRVGQTTFGEVFRKEGMISTPMEERARYLYALSQELEHTLSLIDGVIKARVHVVLPEKIAPGEPTQPSSAAVFIKHVDTLDPDIILPRVRKMVASSIPGLHNKTKEKLAVVFVPAAAYVPPALIDEDEYTVLLLSIGLAIACIVALGPVIVLSQPKLRDRFLTPSNHSSHQANQQAANQQADSSVQPSQATAVQPVNTEATPSEQARLSDQTGEH